MKLSLFIPLVAQAALWRTNPASWTTVNDDVMGGKSQGSVMIYNDALWFWGKLSPENRGGFASCRRSVGSPDSAHTSYAGMNGIKFTAKGEPGSNGPRTFRVNVSVKSSWNWLMTKTFMVEFQPTPEWKNYAFGFEQFTYTWMAQKSNKYQLTDFLTEINEEGFFVYDKNFDDNFLLTVKDFELY